MSQTQRTVTDEQAAADRELMSKYYKEANKKSQRKIKREKGPVLFRFRVDRQGKAADERIQAERDAGTLSEPPTLF